MSGSKSSRRKSFSSGTLFQGRRAQLQLHFIVVGGGICGLAAAFSLANAGHRVTVLEQAPSLRRPSSGMHLPPNLNKLLYQWGLGNKVEAVTLPSEGMQFHTYTSGKKVGYMKWDDEVLEAFGADYPIVNHSDLYKLIYDAAIGAGVTVRFGARVTAVHPRTPSVTLSSGQVMTADYIVGADGHQSLVREVIVKDQLPRPREVPAFSGCIVYSGNIPGHLMRRDPELRPLLEYSGTMTWMGAYRHAVGYPVSPSPPLPHLHQYLSPHTHGPPLIDPEPNPDHTLSPNLNLNLMYLNGVRNEYCLHFYNMDDTHTEQFWKVIDRPKDDPGLNRNTRGCDPILRKLINLLPSAIRVKDVARRHEREWVHRGGKVILLGEAAHPTMVFPFPLSTIFAITYIDHAPQQPCLAQGAATGIEDSVVLGSLFSRVRSRDQIPMFLRAYQELRQERCLAVQANERNLLMTFWIPEGPEQRARDDDMGFAATLGEGRFDMREGICLAQWEGAKNLYGYDASDEAEAWYVEWGMLADRATNAANGASGGGAVMKMNVPMMSVTTTTVTVSVEYS
ncbi:FAD/NAD(P)-binding domain-containing protein [Rickenella mellea]|uniref:FAD/NAD(P)-binding domain-containing protein n=1 Tax=Rickenella mellea TaxID=50990 RepID=A0A4Y7Q5C0_9AGAM|nr:FAD/NAD(P)-binding domain-containing protein [Rickenella mellea]